MANSTPGPKPPHTRKVSRLPPLPETVDPIMEERFAQQRARGAEPINLHLVQGHAPKLSKAKGEFIWSLRNDTKLGRKLLELAIVRTAYLIDCAYELDHHLPMIKKVGYSDAQIAAMKDLSGKAGLFDEREQALLGFVDGICDKGRVDDATYGRLSQHFSPQEIVELTFAVTSYWANGMFVKGLGIEVDQPHIKAAEGKI
jgi:4-carboxymuconolactone decarboxylase